MSMVETITDMVEAGMSVARLNLSHGSLDQHRESVTIIKRVSERLGIPIGTMVDVPGIKYRTGSGRRGSPHCCPMQAGPGLP